MEKKRKISEYICTNVGEERNCDSGFVNKKHMICYFF